MAGMEIAAQGPPPRQLNGRGPPPPRGYPEPRRGPDPGYGGPDFRDDGYGQQDKLRPPASEHDDAAKEDFVTVFLPGPLGNRPPPQRMHPPNPPLPPQNGYDGYDGGQDGYRDTRASFGDVYDAYYQPPRTSNDYRGPGGPGGPGGALDFDAQPSHRRPRGSFDQHMRPGIAEHTQPGAKRMPEMSRTKSQPDLRQSQQAVFEMAGDAPPMPPMNGGYQQNA
uniref:Chitin synthase activator n=1 Tax=Colletotrichum fructicola (strain Nara gc5) TaxID=1213859 RepID=L2FIM1_COLFN